MFRQTAARLAMATAGLVVSGAVLAGGHSGACGKVTIAEMSWASAAFLAHIDGIILKEGYGCDVEMVPGDTVPTTTSMAEKGMPDIAPELWANSARVVIDQAVNENRLVKLNPKPITGAGDGWFISGAIAKAHPELKTVDDVLARPDLFPHPEAPSKGAFHTCPAGWGCEIVNTNLFRAFDMEAKGWMPVLPGSGAGLDGSIARAGERDGAWFGYYWAPTTLIGKYGFQPVDWDRSYDAKNWDECIALPEDQCDDPKESSWTVSEVVSLATIDFASKAPVAAEYVQKRAFDLTLLGKYLTYMDANQAAGEDGAIEFLLQEEAIWQQWVTPDAAQKIKAAL